MPFDVNVKRGARALAAALSVTALFAAPAHAGTVGNPYACAPQPVLTQAFSAWADSNLYTPVPNAGLETGSTGWTLGGGAAVVSGNETFYIASRADSHSLDLPAGASAITAPLCIDETYPHFRLFGRNTGAATGALKVEVLYLDTNGKVLSTKAVDYNNPLSNWSPSGFIGINVFTSKTTVAAAPVAFRFTAGKNAHYQIDDVYVDPWARAR
jgi:hypothetical protein